MFKSRFALFILSAVFIVLAFFRLQFPDLDHGDEYSDANILSAGENFVRFGFLKCKFLPMFEVNAKEVRNLYTHVPPLPDILNGLQRLLFRTDSLPFFRMVAVCVAFLNLFFWYVFIKDFSARVLVAFLAGLFYLTNSMFLYGIDALHQPSYANALLPAIFFTYFQLLKAQGRRPFLYFLVWFLYFIMSLLTYEFVIYLALFFIVFPFLLKNERKMYIPKLYIFVLMLAPLCGFLLHLLQNAWYFGSLGGALTDLRRAAFERIAHSKDMVSRHLTLSLWWQLALMRHFSLAFMFNFFILFTFLFISYFFYRNVSQESKDMLRPLMRLCLLFVICGISWYVVFPSHSVAHAFVNFLGRLLVPAASLAFTLFVYILYILAKEKYSRSPLKFALLAGLMVIIAGTGIEKSALPILGKKLDHAKDFLRFRQCLLELRSLSESQDVVGINYFRYPFIRYYTHRNTLPIFEKGVLEEISPLPRFFIFLPYGNPSSMELFSYLQEKYVPLFECKSQRFPALICELKK
ncbi:MAG: hypothetical protein AMJ95_07085 [Omnitrophica WOR_2 bacterium SM23_72]|nr:MAG: hypothetical protein AMJ95_07085 [Omnitrophica WOR_2 bacterium SM23_72]